MIRLQVIFLGLFLLLSPFAVTPYAAAAAPENVTLKVSEVENNYVLSVPISKLVMLLPKGNLIQKQNAVGGSTASPRYFYFQDKGRTLMVSGWFESSINYSDFNKYWNEDKDSWRSRNLPTPTNAKFFKVGGWEGVVYDLPFPKGENSHIRAHWLQAGTWIDLHLSLTSESRNSRSREELLELLNSIQVKQRP